VKITIISDIHGNLEALTSLPKQFDELWVLGDLVNYGPDPIGVVEFVQANASAVVRGNHDHATGFDQDPRCSKPFREMADTMKEYTRSVLSESHKKFLRELPLTTDREAEGVRVTLCHAIPSDPLFAYCLPGSDRWEAELEQVNADILLVGHTHIPFVREFGARTVVNPGSLGQPKTGTPAARYAVWDTDRGRGGIELRSFDYPFERTIAKIDALPIRKEIRNSLAAVLRSGGLPGTATRRT
jgi:putative phosphoesterase